MILASLESKVRPRDGRLVVVHPNRKQYLPYEPQGKEISFLEVLETWSEGHSHKLKDLALGLAGGEYQTQLRTLNLNECESVLPRTFLFADGSAFIHHIKLVRQARKAPLPETLATVPLMYQAESAKFLKPLGGIPQLDFSHGTDFEAEVGVVTDFVPMGTSALEALSKILFCVLINDVSLRGLIPAELAQGFGFFQSKPAKALSPFALSLDELSSSWERGRLKLPLCIDLNGEVFGRPNAQEMHFHFGELISHAAKTRDLYPGTLIGSGTVSNENSQVGSGCLAEKRTLETIVSGEAKTPFMKVGDEVRIWMEDTRGANLFGTIHQKVVAAR